jgi:hypothetical protein
VVKIAAKNSEGYGPFSLPNNLGDKLAMAEQPKQMNL